MRSSKSRSRSKQNRPRTLGNITNRVFDSSGPEGKVRGTPQQIIEKYQLLARDAQLSNDRVAAENFLQHAEHYTRMLAEAQREMAAEQEARQQQHQQHQNGNGYRDRGGDRDRDYRVDSSDEAQPYPASPEGFDVLGEDDGAALVDLPEAGRRSEPVRRDEPRREDRPRDDSRRREDRPRDDTRRRDDRPRDDRARDDRPREERARDDRPREDRPREDRPRDERPREERPRRDPRPVAAEPAADLPAFLTAPLPQPVAELPVAAAPVEVMVDAPAEVPTDAPAKPARAPRPRKPAAPKAETPKTSD